MSKQDVVSKAKADFISAQDQAVQSYGEAVYDGAIAEAPVGGGDPSKIFSQEELDGAVQKAVADQAGLDSQALADAQAQADAKLGEMQVAFDALSAKELFEEGEVEDAKAKIADAKAKVDSVQEAFDAIRAVFSSLGLPSPAPAPIEPDPQP